LRLHAEPHNIGIQSRCGKLISRLPNRFYTFRFDLKVEPTTGAMLSNDSNSSSPSTSHLKADTLRVVFIKPYFCAASPDFLAISEDRPRLISTNQRGSRAAPSADDGVVVTVRVTRLAWNYAARVLLFPDRAPFAFLADFVATNLVSEGAAAAALLPELSTDVVRISR
jgi:hypothetical protein